MRNTYSEASVTAPQPDEIKLRRLKVTLGNLYVRLAARERRKVMRLLEQFTFGKKRSAADSDPWSKAEMKLCYSQLVPISQEFANDFRRWASELLRVGHNNRLALRCLLDELEVRTWIEDPESGIYG